MCRSLWWASLVVLVIAGGAVSCALTAAPRPPTTKKESRWLRKAVIYQTKDANVSYTVTLSSKSTQILHCSIEFDNRGKEPIFFLRSHETFTERSPRNYRELHFSIGTVGVYSDYVIPKLEEISAGERTTTAYEIDCKADCEDLNFVAVDFSFIVEKGDFFQNLFESLPDYGDTLGLNIGKDWDLFYSYLQTETMTFTLVPLKS